MSGELNKSEIEVNQKDSIEKFTFLELVKHPIDTAKYIVAVLPATFDLATSTFSLSDSLKRFGRIDPNDVQKITNSAERIATALDFLKEVNPSKAEKMQTGLRTIIAKNQKR